MMLLLRKNGPTYYCLIFLADFTKRPSFFGKPLRKTGHLQYLCGRTYSIITLYLIYVEIKHKKCLDSNIPFQALDFRKASM